MSWSSTFFKNCPGFFFRADAFFWLTDDLIFSAASNSCFVSSGPDAQQLFFTLFLFDLFLLVYLFPAIEKVDSSFLVNGKSVITTS